MMLSVTSTIRHHMMCNSRVFNTSIQTHSADSYKELHGTV